MGKQNVDVDMDGFQLSLGKAIMYCQMIEFDVKRIYADLKPGNFQKNLDAIKRRSLGETLQFLESEVDTGSQKVLSKHAYSELHKVVKIRNDLAHAVCMNFLGDDDHSVGYLVSFKKTYDEVKGKRDYLRDLSRTVEKVRKKVHETYRR